MSIHHDFGKRELADFAFLAASARQAYLIAVERAERLGKDRTDWLAVAMLGTLARNTEDAYQEALAKQTGRQ